MSSILTQSQSISPYSGLDLEMTTEEANAWALFEPYVAAKTALWVDATSTLRVRGAGDRDSSSQFFLRDWVGRTLRSGVPNRHPVYVIDTTSGHVGKPVLAFGAGGWRPNFISAADNGWLLPPSMTDVTGTEINDTNFFTADQAYTVAAKVCFPVPSSTQAGIDWSSTTGGTLIGGGSVTPDNCFTFYFDLTNGNQRVRNKAGASGITEAVDRRDGLWHTYIATYDPVANEYNWWVDSVLKTPVSSGTGIISGDTPARKLRVGGYASPPAPGIRQPLNGMLAYLSWLPYEGSSGDIAILHALMATK